MKGIILAGGTGSRLYPITHTSPKQLIPLANKPILDYAIQDLREAGITEIGVILGNKGRKAIQRHLGDGSDYDVDITYIVQGTPLGLAHAVGCAQNFVGDDPFVVYLGDNYVHQGIESMVENFDDTKYSAGIGLQNVENPSRYGVVELDDDGIVTRLVEKPDDPPSSLALMGIYIFTPEIFEQIDGLKRSWRGEMEITHAIQSLLEDDHQLQPYTLHSEWKDVGKPDDVLQANRLALDDIQLTIDGTIEEGASVTGEIELGADAVIEAGAKVWGPVSIGPGTRIKSNANIGPFTSIGEESEINNASIKSSIVMGENKITAEESIVDSLIGRKATIRPQEDTRSESEQLIVGRDSELRL